MDKKPISKEAREEQIQKDKIEGSICTTETHFVDCCVCGASDETDGTSQEGAAREFYDEGWRYGSSDKLGVEGLMCPDCSEKPDSERGED